MAVQGTGAPLIRGALADPSWQDFQPRAGLPYRPFNDNQTAIRAGFGIYYSLQDANSLAFEQLSPPFEFESTVLNLPPVVAVRKRRSSILRRVLGKSRVEKSDYTAAESTLVAECTTTRGVGS